MRYTKSTFLLVAAIVNGVESRTDREWCIREFSAMFRADNPRFDVDRFREACREGHPASEDLRMEPMIGGKQP